MRNGGMFAVPVSFLLVDGSSIEAHRFTVTEYAPPLLAAPCARTRRLVMTANLCRANPWPVDRHSDNKDRWAAVRVSAEPKSSLPPNLGKAFRRNRQNSAMMRKMRQEGSYLMRPAGGVVH